MARHHLVERAKPSQLLDVTSRIGGLHAQVMSSAELSLWARIDGLDPTAVQEALWTARSLVKLWATRGTLYLLPARELGVWFSALGASSKHHNIGFPEMDALSEAVGRALEGKELSREELAREVERSTGSATFGEWVRFSWGSYLKAAAYRGLICFAQSEGTHIRFTHPATWVDFERCDPTDAMREITRHFVSAYAPCSPEEVAAWWVGPPQPRTGRRMLKLLGGEVVEVNVEGFHAFALATDVQQMAAASTPNAARLLPAFDPWTVGASRHPPLQELAYEPRVHRPQGWISPVLLVDGRIVGVWKHTLNGRRLTVELEPFERLPRWARSQFEQEAQRLRDFVGGELTLSWAG